MTNGGGGTPSIEGHISRHVKGAGVTYAATETCTPLYSYGKRHSSHMCRELHPLQGTHSTYSLLLTHTGKTPPHKRHTQSGPMLLPRRTRSPLLNRNLAGGAPQPVTQEGSCPSGLDSASGTSGGRGVNTEAGTVMAREIHSAVLERGELAPRTPGHKRGQGP